MELNVKSLGWGFNESLDMVFDETEEIQRWDNGEGVSGKTDR